MSLRHATRVAVALVVPLSLQACATKGFVRNEVSALRSHTDSSLVAERNARVAGDNENAARIEALRAELDSLRTNYGARITAMEDGIRFAMPVNFAFNDDQVRGDAQPVLERFARVASRYYPGSLITIEGFADPAGSARYNMNLSKRRAENVRRSLESLGLTGNPLRTIAYGESRLVHPGAAADDPGAQQNRRVVFVIENVGAEAAVAIGPMH